MGSSVKSILASRDYSSSSSSQSSLSSLLCLVYKKRLTNQGTKIPAGIAPRNRGSLRVTAQIDGNLGGRHGMA